MEGWLDLCLFVLLSFISASKQIRVKSFIHSSIYSFNSSNLINKKRTKPKWFEWIEWVSEWMNEWSIDRSINQSIDHSINRSNEQLDLLIQFQFSNLGEFESNNSIQFNSIQFNLVQFKSIKNNTRLIQIQSVWYHNDDYNMMMRNVMMSK